MVGEKTDRRASFEGFLGCSGHRSPASEGSPDRFENSSPIHSVPPVTRRRLLRARLSPNESPQPTPPTWVDSDKGEARKAKPGQITARKALGGNSPHNSTLPKPSSAELESSERERDTVGFLPKLSRILEGKESKAPRRRRSSTVSSTDDYISARRRRPVEDASLARRPVRQKHGSLQRRAESLANLPNPSLVSVLSGLTIRSNTSSGSNSTITQKSYDKSHVSKRRQTKERERLQTKRVPTKTKAMEVQPLSSSVFQYLNDGLTSEQFLNGSPGGGRPQSSSSSASSSASSSDSEHHEGLSSNAEEPLDESPMTSPASIRRPIHEESHYRERFNSDSGISVRESSPDSLTHAPVNYH
ncbi:hypothetical protein K469DRAFT_11054 [Zopfia rhizophila CBS 207.26]|uniref:Uncharacterized protein n=1 Tax=Zopfia rhizophila CBS 207.26 TaxID=1314779 RepID=A0A6A6ETC9_9PEZI|nr:hypothetical protein K469DRAFT_11054 [Zopfia rhizophila CBS 207.26]